MNPVAARAHTNGHQNPYIAHLACLRVQLALRHRFHGGLKSREGKGFSAKVRLVFMEKRKREPSTMHFRYKKDTGDRAG